MIVVVRMLVMVMIHYALWLQGTTLRARRVTVTAGGRAGVSVCGSRGGARSVIVYVQQKATWNHWNFGTPVLDSVLTYETSYITKTRKQ